MTPKEYKQMMTWLIRPSKARGPRNMQLAKVNDIPDAFNPDLEQTEVLRPGETLEDWKPNPFLKPHAEGGRIGFAGGHGVGASKQKLDQVIGAYRRYRRGEKNPKLNFKRFFEIYAKENFADGGRAGYNAGQLVTPSIDGSRPGYNGRYEDTEYGSRVKYDTKLKKYVKRVARTVDGKKNYNVYIEQKTNENMKQFLERVAEKGKSQISRAKIARDKINLEQRMYTNNWTKNWLDQNLEKYGVRQFDKMLKDMSNAWQKHVPKIKIPGSDTSAWTTKVLKLPNITTSRGLESAVTKRPFTYEGFTFYTNLESSDEKISKSKSQWRKAFFKNKIRTIHGLEKKMKAYFDFINTPGVGTKKTMAFKEFADKDVLYILSNEDSGLIKKSRYELFNSFKSLAKPYNDFTSKINRSETWKQNANLIEDNLRSLPEYKNKPKNWIKNSLTAEGKKIKKLFDLKGLPDGLGYSIEHGQGISAAAKTGNVEIMKRAVNDLIGTTRRHNTQLGFHGFEANRNALIREIMEGRNVKANIKSLNTLAKDVYKDFGLKGNMYSIKNGVLTSKPISTALTETDRFRQYAIQLAKDPEGLDFIKKRHGSLEKMLSLLCTKKASGGRIGYSTGTPTVKCGSKRLEQIILRGGAKEGEQELAKKILQAGRGLRVMFSLSGMFGPAATAFLVGTEAGLVGYDMISQGKTFREAVGDSVFNYALGDRTKIDPAEERYKRYAKQGFDVDKIRAFEKNIDRIDEINLQYGDLYKKANVVNIGGPRRSDAIKQKQQIISDKAIAELPLFTQDLFRTGEIPRLSKFLEKDYVEGMKNISEADRLSEIDRLSNINPLAIGKIRAMEDEKRLRELKLQNPDVRAYMGPYPTMYGFASGGRAGYMGGGIAAIRKPSAIPPESGPNSQGLPGLLKRVRNL